jgi:hypothetical protein
MKGQWLGVDAPPSAPTLGAGSGCGGSGSLDEMAADILNVLVDARLSFDRARHGPVGDAPHNLSHKVAAGSHHRHSKCH